MPAHLLSDFPTRKGIFMNKLVTATAVLFFAVAFQAQAAEPKEEKTASGIGVTTLKEGSGANPKASDTVKVHYRGTLLDGKEFDSSHKRGQPATFPLSRVIPCWTEGVQKIKVGGKAKLVCPPGSGLRQPERAGNSARFYAGFRSRTARNRQVENAVYLVPGPEFSGPGIFSPVIEHRQPPHVL